MFNPTGVRRGQSLDWIGAIFWGLPFCVCTAGRFVAQAFALSRSLLCTQVGQGRVVKRFDRLERRFPRRIFGHVLASLCCEPRGVGGGWE